MIALVGREHFAFPVGSVGEVIEIPVPSPVPLAPDFFQGIVSVKGEIIPVVDASMLLFDKKGCGSGTVVVIRRAECVLAISVDLVEGMREIVADSLALATFEGYRQRFFLGTVPYNDTLLTLVDLDGIIQFVAQSVEGFTSGGATA